MAKLEGGLSLPASRRFPFRKIIGAVGLAALILCLGVGLFYAYVLFAWSNPPKVSHRVALADLDGDGDLDAILANGVNEGKTESTIWINQGGAQGGQPGIFADSDQRLGSADYQTLAAGDLDNDGDLDLLLGNAWMGLEMFINQGRAQGGQVGQFVSARIFNGAEFWGGLHPIGLGDLDGDGDLDVLTGNCCGGLMMPAVSGGEPQRLPASNWLFTNQTAESGLSNVTKWPAYLSTQLPQEETDGTEALALGDLDGDGDLDAFLAKTIEQFGSKDTYIRRTFYKVWRNNSKGHFSDSGLRLEAPNIADLALGDLDGDGDLDALAASSRSGGQVVINQGGAQGGKPGEFAIQPGMLGKQMLTAVFLGDLNGDGSLDALLESHNQAQIWFNDGKGHFKQSPTIIRHSNRHAVTIGDVDGDGDVDIFVGKLAEEYQVWKNDGTGRFSR